MAGKIIQGVERDRAIIRGAALSIIRHIIDQPIFDKMKRGEMRRDWLAPPPHGRFKRLEPLGFGLQQDDWWVFRPEDCTPDLVWPLDVGSVCEDGGEMGGLSMQRSYTVTPKQARGYAHRFGPFMLRMDHAQMDVGQLMTASSLWVWLGGQWTDASKRVMWEGRSAESAIPTRSEVTARDRMVPSLATAIALKQRYQWAVSLGLENSPSIRFATDPTGIKDVFRIRDMPDGKDRREALLTWVTDHWRQDRYDPEMETYVRRHLRGATQFSWRGMDCELLPSQFDVDQRDKAIGNRDAMRAAGVDRRAVS